MTYPEEMTLIRMHPSKKEGFGITSKRCYKGENLKEDSNNEMGI